MALLQPSGQAPTTTPALVSHVIASPNPKVFPISHTQSETGNHTHFALSCVSSGPGRPWILNSGASDHICSSLDLFSFYKRIKPIIVKLPNGSSVQAQFDGTVHFTSTFYLVNVLFIHNFSYNLISISKLTSNLHCSLIFTSTRCFIQEMRSSRMIGSAKHLNGLYYMDELPKMTRVCSHLTQTGTYTPSISNDELWHYHLGHLSHQRLNVLCRRFPVVSYSDNEILPCDVCQFAKQKRIYYSLSRSKAT